MTKIRCKKGWNDISTHHGLTFVKCYKWVYTNFNFEHLIFYNSEEGVSTKFDICFIDKGYILYHKKHMFYTFFDIL